jgi:hypothetical protein
MLVGRERFAHLRRQSRTVGKEERRSKREGRWTTRLKPARLWLGGMTGVCLRNVNLVIHGVAFSEVGGPWLSLKDVV